MGAERGLEAVAGGTQTTRQHQPRAASPPFHVALLRPTAACDYAALTLTKNSSTALRSMPDWLSSSFALASTSDAAVPAPKDAGEAEVYRRREAKLNAAVSSLTYAERGESPEGRLAAAIGARLADWRDGDEDE